MFKRILFSRLWAAALLLVGAAAIFAASNGKVFPYSYTQEDLPNGLRLITIPTEFPNIVSLYIVVQTGSRNEVEPGLTGFAHLFEHMMFRGTEKFPTAKYEEELKRTGAASNAFTSNDLTAYHTTFSKEDLEPILAMEADRFQHLKYTPAEFKTETLAVLGEYNKSSSNPTSKLSEVLRDTAFDRHTYKHTTMGFLKDVQDMPNHYDYSLQFFDRYYRPEYTTIIVTGDVQPKAVRPLVDRYWSMWKRGSFKSAVPPEPPQKGPRTNHVDWSSPTLPWVAVAFKNPAYADDAKDTAALDALAYLAFSENSDLYQKLVIQEQKVDSLSGDNDSSVDPSLFLVRARVKKIADVPAVRDRILATVDQFRSSDVSAERLDAVKRHLRYSFSLHLNNSEAIGETVAEYVALRRTPETINRLYEEYASLTPADIRSAANKYLIADWRTIVTLSHKQAGAHAEAPAPAPANVVAMPDKSPLVTFRITFLTGVASDPADKPGLASLTASMLTEGGTRDLTYKQIVDALFPMAASVSSRVDKEMTTVSAATHVENLEAFYKLFRAMLLEPGWRQEDFTRLKDDSINYLRVSLRGNNDEELGKEVLYNLIYGDHPYGHQTVGTASALEKMTLNDARRFYAERLMRAPRVIGLAGGYPPDFLERVQHDFGGGGALMKQPLPAPKPIDRTQLTIIEKDTRSVALSLGFPIDVKRGDPDYPALLVMQSWLGQHRSSGGRLFQRMRELRGLNYGDYAYIEYFPRGMFRMEPESNLARQQQIFQIWVRPVEPPTGHFALRLAMYELDRLLKHGIPAEEFEQTRSFLGKYVNVLTKTKSAELGYAIDSKFYGIGDYNSYLKDALAKLTIEDVNRAIRKHLHTDRLRIVVVSKNAADLKQRLASDEASPITYNSPKPKEIQDEDKVVAAWKLNLRPEDITIVPVDRVFE